MSPTADLAQRLEEAVVRGEFRPRERLTELGLSERYGATRNRVRQALAALERKGLVVISPGHGAVVADYTPQQVRDMYTFRRIVELGAVEAAADRVTAGDIKTLRALAARFARAVPTHDLGRLRAANDEFHRCIHRLAGNEFLSKVIDQLWLISHVARHFAWLDPARLEASAREHDEIVSAFEVRDIPRLKQIYEQHIMRGLQSYLRHVQFLQPEVHPTANPWRIGAARTGDHSLLTIEGRSGAGRGKRASRRARVRRGAARGERPRGGR